MMIRMKITLRNGVERVIGLEYTKHNMDICRYLINTQLSTFLYLDDCPDKGNQDRYFKDFLEQEIERYEDRRNAEDGYDEENVQKPFKEVSRPSVIKIDQKFYFVSGKDQVFFLDTDDQAQKLSRKLDLEEISSLSVDLLYTGKKEEFSDDEVPAFAELISIIYNMNLMQEEKFWSFPLATLLQFCMGFLYSEIMDEQNNFMTFVVASGSGNTNRTGKSLLTSMWQLVFDGHKTKEGTLSITEAAIFTKLDKGIPVYIGEWYKHQATLNLVVKALWERMTREVNKKVCTPRAIVYISANIQPSDVQFKDANESKVKFIASGSKPLAHDDKMMLADLMEQAATRLHKYLPVILALAIQCTLPKITDHELRSYDGILKVNRDEREGQLLLNYDRLFAKVEAALIRLQLPKPGLFTKGFLDRTSLTFYNSEQDEETVEDSAHTLVDYILENDLIDQMTFSERAEGFRLKLEYADLPEDIVAAAKRCCREMSTTVNAVKTRVKFLSVKLIEDGLVMEMKRAMETLDSWTAEYVMDSAQNAQEYGEEFFDYANESLEDGPEPTPAKSVVGEGSTAPQDSESDASGTTKTSSVEPSSLGTNTTKTSVQPKAKEQSTEQPGADKSSSKGGSDKPKGALKFKDSGRGKNWSKKPQLELDSGEDHPKSTEEDRTERLDRRAKRKAESSTTNSSDTSPQPKPKSGYQCKKVSCPDHGKYFKSKTHTRSKRHKDC